MSADGSGAVLALERRYLHDFPREAARRMESLPLEEVAEILAEQPAEVAVPVWEGLPPYRQEALLDYLPEQACSGLVAGMDPPLGAELLQRLQADRRQALLGKLPGTAATQLQTLMEYAPDTAGRLMDPRVVSFRRDMTVAEAVERMRSFKRTRALREIFLVDEDGKLCGRAEVEDLAVSSRDEVLEKLSRPVAAAVLDMWTREEVVEKLEQQRVPLLPVVNVSGRFIGVITQSALLTALQEETSVDIQTMVGASREERALSKVGFAVRKRLPWLQINLATAFLAAAVVGLFEDTIAAVTALAVLMPVVAGQSGNAGAQALAVTMRGLALREISIRQTWRMIFKEISVGFLNGMAVAATTAICVYFWNGSAGLVAVICIAMVVSMVAAGLAGAVIPIALTRFGQDPAQSSSIVLTTVTDVVGFFSFLGVATLMRDWL